MTVRELRVGLLSFALFYVWAVVGGELSVLYLQRGPWWVTPPQMFTTEVFREHCAGDHRVAPVAHRYLCPGSEPALWWAEPPVSR